jgi:S1-C subfamily serine protease
VAGAFLGSRLAPVLLHGGSESPYAPLVSLVVAVVLGGVIATVLETLGFELRRRMGPTLGTLDGAAGAVLVACFGLGLVWVGGAVALQTPGARHLRRDIQRSTILQALNGALPPSGPLLNALARFDPLPSVNGPPADVAAPNSRIARDPEVRAAGRSVVRVLGTACGLGVQGSGWVAGNGIVVTNAHVVAGESDTAVQVEGQGPHLNARAIYFDPHDDVAVLRVSGLSGVPALRLHESASSGTSGAILGFPHDGPYDVEPARLGSTTTVLTQDAYGRGPVRRSITSFRGLVRSGNSGGPVVDGNGRVMATVFAASVGTSRHTGFGVPDSVVRDALSRARGPVSTGACAG